MRKRDLTEIIGRRDGRAVSAALAANWNWNGSEREGTTVASLAERQRKVARRLARLGVKLAN